MIRGDLVSWRRDDNNMVGVVLDVYPANIYEKEVCRVIAAGSLYVVDSVYLVLHNERPEDAQLYDRITSGMEGPGPE